LLTLLITSVSLVFGIYFGWRVDRREAKKLKLETKEMELKIKELEATIKKSKKQT